MSIHGTTVQSKGSQTIAAGGTSQVVFPATGRNFLLIHNCSTTENLYIGIGFTPSSTAGIVLTPCTGSNSTLILQGNDIPNDAINAIAATTGHAFIAIQE